MNAEIVESQIEQFIRKDEFEQAAKLALEFGGLEILIKLANLAHDYSYDCGYEDGYLSI